MDLDAAYRLLREFWVVWMMILFFAIVFWAYRPKNKKRFEDAARIPFKDDQ
ncbi:MAG: cbb3-type cytochrome c oxidase subunit 3 [Rhodospirillales bacterium]|jgi:cytochrome c oxidase cbb3-type subunit 4|nr:cbb3-type cytochrome c oxidase subunit 3 [Rhodospirillales bacterium]